MLLYFSYKQRDIVLKKPSKNSVKTLLTSLFLSKGALFAHFLVPYVTHFRLSAKQAVAEPLYWQAKKEDLTLTILGSVHVGDESMYPLPAQITDTLKQSDGLIVETDIRKTEGVVYPTTTVTTGDVLNKEQNNY